MHCKVQLEDADIEEQFKELCKKFTAVFSKDASDIGKTKLVTMDIDSGDNSPVCQRPYYLPLIHASCIHKEFRLLEKTGIMVSFWCFLHGLAL